ncbi:MAG: hypothetical protein BRC44_05915 [Cyanobacteria bacterium QS_4_48_99]|nr:MAG: hypothetical protein BRC44_05915 [Cyanobacteria bacterium QS_4_48_99]
MLYQPDKCSSGWTDSISEHRKQLEEDLETSPSLRNHFEEVFDSAYSKARVPAHQQTGLPINTFPNSRPFTLRTKIGLCIFA